MPNPSVATAAEGISTLSEVRKSHNPMKFSNDDISFDDIVERNKGHVCLSNVDLLMEVVNDPTWK